MQNKAAMKTEARGADTGPSNEMEEVPQAATFSASVTRRRKPAERPAAKREAAGREQPTRDLKPAASGVGRYLEVLGVGPNASFDAINTAYYTCIKRFPENPTEEDEVRLQDIKRAYDILKRNYQPKTTKGFSLSLSFSIHSKGRLALLGVAVVVMLGGLLAMNWKMLRLKMVHYDNGTVVALKGKSEPYGQIVGFESMHPFPAGNPSAAYELKLEGRDMTVWVGERLVVNGMQPLRAK